ncbi:hypothetical protein [Bosea sp. NBC_00550]|uniref:hypothetical protein n=1 Tax=Bosea sp. NBC_00550 TaxID=2969621 RepID=UPI002232942E|nr:hypothetical protein [Bosea sp. NBC_00550]UZF94479.1 hypothetical protein NWE53_10020 [Bosea sp. NBC_00550]
MEQQSRRIGAYEVSILHDGIFEAPLDVLIHAGGQAARTVIPGRPERPSPEPRTDAVRHETETFPQFSRSRASVLGSGLIAGAMPGMTVRR